MHAVRIVAFGFAVVLAPLAAAAQSYQTYQDWSTVCDNLRRCSAFGYAPENAGNAYVQVSRGGGADVEPTVELVVQSDGPARDRKLEATVLTGPHRRFSVGPLAAVGDGNFAHAIVPAPLSVIFAGALRDATMLEIRLVDRPTADERATVSLAGSSAALRAMDARQLRAGTTTALVARGSLPASSMPATPPAPSLTAHPMRELAVPRSPGPNLVPNADPICHSVSEMWLALGDGRRLRGICAVAGAYNTGYRFFVVDGRRVAPASFRIPWRAPTPYDAEIVNPELSKDGLLLSGFAKGIGLGTCGEASDWIWTGRGFRLFHFTEMRDCRGVTSEGWPVLFQARLAH